MLKFYQAQPPSKLSNIVVGGICPHCKTGTRFMLTTVPNDVFVSERMDHLVINYSCEICLEPIPIQWETLTKGYDPVVDYPETIMPSIEEFDFGHIPNEVKIEIKEALDCLSVNSYNGFAAVCRRAIQAICNDFGAAISTRIKKQIEEITELHNLEKEIKEIAMQVMLSGHDGSHPHLPEVNHERATILLTLLKDLVYELYTRPGKILEAQKTRKEAISQKKEQNLENDNPE